GPNGSGKSNFIGVFGFLHAIREGRLSNYVTESGGAEKVLHFGAKTTATISLSASFRNEVNKYQLTLGPTADDNLYPSSEVVEFRLSDGSGFYSERLPPKGREARISDPQLKNVPGWVRHHIGSWRVYHLHDTSASSTMRKTARVNDNRFLRPD